MTEPDSTADDEIVSAYLDGEASPEEVARVESEPALQARLEAFRSAAAAVSATPGVDPEQRDLRITRALAAAGVPEQGATVSELDGRRRAREQGRAAGASGHRSRNLLLGAAAVVAVLVLGAGLIPRLLDDEDTGQTTAFSAVGDEVDDESDLDAGAEEDAGASLPGANEDRAEGGEAFTESTVAPFDAVGGPTDTLPDLGDHATRADFDVALAGELRQRLSEPAPPLSDPGSGCVPAITAGDTELVDLVYGATARIEGVALEALVFAVDPTTSANGTLRLYLVDPVTCTPVPGGVETFGS